MDTVEITLKLPEDLVARAKSAGLLTEDRIAALLAAELERRVRVGQLFDDMERLRAMEPPLTPEAIHEEIAAHREEKRAGSH